MSLSNSAETLTLTWLFTTGSATRPTAWYVGLHTSNPDEDDSGTEVSGGGYVRQGASFTVSGNTATTSGAVEFPTATANYGTVTHCGIYDASTGGNLVAYASLTSSKTIETGDVFRIPAGDLDVTFD
jgi:hypothetical protein